MICPRWLVQSSAAGVVVCAFMAVPFFVAPPEPVVASPGTLTEPPRAVTGETVVKVRHHQIKEVKPSDRQTDLDQRNARAKEVRTHLYELYDGPKCPTAVKGQEPEALQEARKAVEKGYYRALNP
jgi:hypothetical protein